MLQIVDGWSEQTDRSRRLFANVLRGARKAWLPLLPGSSFRPDLSPRLCSSYDATASRLRNSQSSSASTRPSKRVR